jgi:uncharacterized protein YjgD (DUF1641 family)
METKELKELEEFKALYEGATKDAVKIIDDFLQRKITREQLKEKLEPYQALRESTDRKFGELLKKIFRGKDDPS